MEDKVPICVMIEQVTEKSSAVVAQWFVLVPELKEKSLGEATEGGE